MEAEGCSIACALLPCPQAADVAASGQSSYNPPGGTSFVLFGCLKFAGLLRVTVEGEELGLDVIKHGGTAYETNFGGIEETGLDSSKHGGTLYNHGPPPLVSTALAAASRNPPEKGSIPFDAVVATSTSSTSQTASKSA